MNESPEMLDVQALARLHVDLGCDTRALRRFVGDFVDMWPTRKARLVAAVDAHDVDEVTVVLLSISSSSTMTGAIVLADSCSEMLRRVSESVHRVPAADSLEGISGGRLVVLGDTGDASCRQLKNYIDTRYASAS